MPSQFQVERRNEDTRIDICCAGKPGLLLSTISTMEALGLEIEQCIISCFNDFAIQASCSEVQRRNPQKNRINSSRSSKFYKKKKEVNLHWLCEFSFCGSNFFFIYVVFSFMGTGIGAENSGRPWRYEASFVQECRIWREVFVMAEDAPAFSTWKWVLGMWGSSETEARTFFFID